MLDFIKSLGVGLVIYIWLTLLILLFAPEGLTVTVDGVAHSVRLGK